MTPYPYTYLSNRFVYDASTGLLTWATRPLWHFATESGWKCFNNRDAGTVAGTRHKSGYVVLRVDQMDFYTHRIAWVLGTHSEIPAGMTIDHINGNRSDNRLCNLRLATRAENNRNSKRREKSSLPKGIHFDKSRQKYMAYINVDGKRTSRRFASLYEAISFLDSLRPELHGQFGSSGERDAR